MGLPASRSPHLVGAPTLGLKKHIEEKCAGWDRTSAVHQSQLTNFFGAGAAQVLTQDSLNEQILKFFISGNIPFNQADNPEFCKIIKLIKLSSGNIAEPPSRKVIRECLRKHHIESEADLKARFQKLDSKIGLALDAWSTRSMQAFLGNTP
jgi:hypothetical protein